MFKQLLKNEKGSAFLMAIMGLAIISIITVTAVFMGSTNAKQTHTEGKRTQAYYVADAGAKTMVEELKGLPANELQKKLVEMEGLGTIKGEYTDDTTSGTPVKYKFELEVEKDPTAEIYELRSTGYSNDGVKDGTRAILALEELPDGGGGGRVMGDGVIYITDSGNGTFQFHNFGQFAGIDLSIYTVNKSVTAINDGTGGYNKTKIDGNGLVGEMFVKQGNPKDHKVEMVYNSSKELILDKYSDIKLNGLIGDDLKTALASTYFLPITTEDNYNAFLSDKAEFPLAPVPDELTEKGTKISLPGKGTVDLTGSRYVYVDSKLNINGTLDIETSGDIDIVLKKGFHMTLGSKFNIHADGRVNVYLEADTGTDGGNIKVISPKDKMAQVNFYVGKGVPFQMQDATEVIGGVNLYAPTSDVQFQEKVQWEGIVVAKLLQFNDNAKFRAPSAGSDSSNMNKIKEWKLKPIEWKEWQK